MIVLTLYTLFSWAAGWAFSRDYILEGEQIVTVEVAMKTLVFLTISFPFVLPFLCGSLMASWLLKHDKEEK